VAVFTSYSIIQGGRLREGAKCGRILIIRVIIQEGFFHKDKINGEVERWQSSILGIFILSIEQFIFEVLPFKDVVAEEILRAFKLPISSIGRDHWEPGVYLVQQDGANETLCIVYDHVSVRLLLCQVVVILSRVEFLPLHVIDLHKEAFLLGYYDLEVAPLIDRERKGVSIVVIIVGFGVDVGSNGVIVRVP